MFPHSVHRLTRGLQGKLNLHPKHLTSLSQLSLGQQAWWRCCCDGVGPRRPGVMLDVSVWMTQVAGRSGGCDSDYTS